MFGYAEIFSKLQMACPNPVRLYYCGFKHLVVPCFACQPTGTPLVPSWSSLPCRASLESLLESSLLPTSQPLRGSIAPSLLASCSLFQVSWRWPWVKLHPLVLRPNLCITTTNLDWIFLKCKSLCPVPKLSLSCLQWPFTRGWQWTFWASASVTGVSPGHTY